MNSPQNEVATNLEQLNELLNVLLEGFCPAETTGESDREVTTPEFQINLLAHSGIEFALKEINDAMKQRGYKLKASNAMELEWMLKRL
jgi:transposase